MLNRVRCDDLNASVAAFRAAPDAIKKRLTDATRTDLSVGWVQEIQRPAHIFNRSQVKFIQNGASAVPTANGIRAFAGAGRSSFLPAKRGDADPRAFEFGTLDREGYTEYYRRMGRGRGAVKVKRRTSRQMPTRSTKGWIAYPAKDRFASRVGKLYGAIVAKVLHDATEGKSS